MEEPSSRLHCGFMVLSLFKYGLSPLFHVYGPRTAGESPCLAMYCSIPSIPDNILSFIIRDDWADGLSLPLYLS